MARLFERPPTAMLRLQSTLLVIALAAAQEAPVPGTLQAGPGGLPSRPGAPVNGPNSSSGPQPANQGPGTLQAPTLGPPANSTSQQGSPVGQPANSSDLLAGYNFDTDAVQLGNSPCSASLVDVMQALTNARISVVGAWMNHFDIFNDSDYRTTTFAILDELHHLNRSDGCPGGASGRPSGPKLPPKPPPHFGPGPNGFDDGNFGYVFGLTRMVAGRYCVRALLEAGQLNSLIGVQLNMSLPMRFSVNPETGWIQVATQNSTAYIVGSHNVCDRSVIHFITGEIWQAPNYWGAPGTGLPAMPRLSDVNIPELLQRATGLSVDIAAQECAAGAGCGSEGEDDSGATSCSTADDVRRYIPWANITGTLTPSVCPYPIQPGNGQPLAPGLTLNPSNATASEESSFPVVAVAVAVPLGVLLALTVLALVLVLLRRRKTLRKRQSQDREFWDKLAQADFGGDSGVEPAGTLWRARKGSKGPYQPSSLAGVPVLPLKDALLTMGIAVNTTPPTVISGATTNCSKSNPLEHNTDSNKSVTSNAASAVTSSAAPHVTAELWQSASSMDKTWTGVVPGKVATIHDSPGASGMPGDQASTPSGPTGNTAAAQSGAGTELQLYSARSSRKSKVIELPDVRDTSYIASSHELQGIGCAVDLTDVVIPESELHVILDSSGQLCRLGSGGFGTVFKGLLRGVTPVAIKLPGGAAALAHGWGGHREQMQLIREVSAMRNAHDPHILQYLGVAFLGEGMVLVTEYCAGGDLFAALTGPQRELYMWNNRGKHLAHQVLQALVYLHASNFVHLDLKPQNVLLDANGTYAKVADLGMALLITQGYLTHVTDVGTFAWAAPELLLGARVSTSADMYSFGVILFQLLTGKVPKRGTLSTEDLDCHPLILTSLLNSCLSHDPTKRPTARAAAKVIAGMIAAEEGSSASRSRLSDGQPTERATGMEPEIDAGTAAGGGHIQQPSLYVASSYSPGRLASAEIVPEEST